MEFLARLLGSDFKAPRISDRGDGRLGEIGDYCSGKDIDECRKLFGDRLKDICANCPD
jgi:hypothetical protein